MVNLKTDQMKMLPSLKKRLTLSAGGKIVDDADVLEFAQKTVPVGSVAIVSVKFRVISLRDA